MSSLIERLGTDELRRTREWCATRETEKPWYGAAGDSPKMLTTCNFMVALIDEVLAARAISQDKPDTEVGG
jgi:hypothetical protein